MSKSIKIDKATKQELEIMIKDIKFLQDSVNTICRIYIRLKGDLESNYSLSDDLSRLVLNEDKLEAK